MANDKTPNYHWDIPNPYGLQIVEMIKVASTFGAIDVRLKAFEDAYQSHKHSFADITNRPTTLSGYGITDAITTEQVKSEIETSQTAQQSVIDQSIQSLANSTADALALRVRVDVAQAFTLAQKSRARQNIDALGTVDRGVPNGVATLDVGGKIPSSQLPPVAITDTFVVNSQASMLALVAERGDVAVRTDLKKSFILRLEPATVLANWQEMLTPTDAVLSVNGKTGVINLSADDVGAATPAQVAAKLDKNNPNYTGTLIGNRFVLKKGTSGTAETLLYLGNEDTPSLPISLAINADGSLSFNANNIETGAWLRSLLRLFMNGNAAIPGTLTTGGISTPWMTITGQGQPVNPGDATPKSYVDNLVNNAKPKMFYFNVGFEDRPWRETWLPFNGPYLLFGLSTLRDGDRAVRTFQSHHKGWDGWTSDVVFGGAPNTRITITRGDSNRFRVDAGHGRTSEQAIVIDMSGFWN